MIRRNDVIKHEQSMDVCFDVINVYEGTDYYKIKGRWMNQGFVESFYMFSRTATIKIMKSNYSKLLYCMDPTSDPCLRKCQWRYYVNRDT